MKKEKKPSIAAFMFMPQIGLSLQGFGHIVPVFMRTLAAVFVQAGLLPENHPALLYGASGVPKYGFSRMMGEAWFTLRTMGGTTYQWCMFASVVFMLATVLGSMLMFLLSQALGLGQAAKAQIFTMTGRPSDSGTMAAYGGTGMFDTTIPPAPVGANGHADYGIMMLDKMLRQGMYGQGGPLQDALRNAFGLYNSGVLVVAGIMLFWIIVSVIVDTAKTGTIGGGRHNMVWAPIRIVFALGLMIPLGTTGGAGLFGFSSGQVIVTKIAEWGSNFASNVWATYVGAAVTGTITNQIVSKNQSATIRAYMDMWLCRVTYNGWNWATVVQTNGQPMPANQEVDATGNGQAIGGEWSYSFTNNTTENLCGRVTLPFYDWSAGPLVPTVPPSVMQRRTEQSWYTAMSEPNIVTPGGTFPSLNRAVAEYVRAIGQAEANFFYDSGGGTGSENPAAQIAKQWACEFAAVFIWDTTNGSPLARGQYSGSATPTVIRNQPICPAISSPGNGLPMVPSVYGGTDPSGGGQARLPNDGAFRELLDDYETAMNVPRAGAPRTTLENRVRDLLQNTVLVRGWGDMGKFYLTLGKLNESLLVTASGNYVTVTPGEMVKSALEQQMRNTNYVNQGGSEEAKVLEVMQRANAWWKQQFSSAAAAADAAAAQGTTFVPGFDPRNGTARPQVYGDPAKPDKGWASRIGDVLAMLNPATQADMMIGKILGLMSIDADWASNILIWTSNDVYPFVHLLAIGDKLFYTGIKIMIGMATISLVVGATGLGGTALISMLGTPIGAVLETMVTVMILAGGVLKFYLPVLPYIRVAFAVLTWMISVFEAVVMLPIAALAHLTTQGDGLAGSAKQCWILWLNILMRPVLVVMGYIGAIMVFNSFVVYLNASIGDVMVSTNLSKSGIDTIIAGLFGACLYVFMIYIVANSCFKMLDLIPNALMRWLGGSPDQSFDDHSLVAGMARFGADRMAGLAGSARKGAGEAGARIHDRLKSNRDTSEGLG
ncbi:MAG: DotA/TraY family protein [Alphaproteobacteria bacterium]|nr:DotA/TraY family protein [Alphaproteobacteria bacterium]